MIGYWFLRRPLEASAAAIKGRPLVALGVGLVGLILVWATIAAFILVFILIPVSYTHLDVYKRQGQGPGSREERSSLAPGTWPLAPLW